MKIKKYKSIIIILILAIITIVPFTRAARGSSKIKYDKIMVYQGDTLWSIALKYNPKNKDVRKTVYEIQETNNLTTSIITPGQQLLIPVYQ